MGPRSRAWNVLFASNELQHDHHTVNLCRFYCDKSIKPATHDNSSLSPNTTEEHGDRHVITSATSIMHALNGK